MVIVLYLVALAMIAGGAAAAVQGYGIILNERGWTMVIAGTTAAAGGFVLLGLAVVAGRLGRAVEELARLRERTGRLDFPTPPLPARPEDRPGVAAAAAGALATAGARPPEDERAVMKAADVIPEPAPAAEASAEPAPATEAPPDEAASAGEPDATQTDAPAAARTEEEAAEGEAAEPAIIGSYSSGGNTYVMYADGSIDADTPDGRFRFKSLDELKEFVAAGGERR
ncbi:MAG TPA: hypothetical protein VM434_12830 [Beijerinckiaceae bacterium]|nr:hypothetical protein [Beijerinckiaceae bacterium]